MRTSIGIATFLAVGAGAVGVSALSLRGSDTLKDLTVKLLTSTTLECGGVGEPTTDGVTGTLTYEGTGSGNGQAAMLGGSQDVAPMSSRMSTAVCTAAFKDKAEGIVFALDGISILSFDGTVSTGTACAGDPNTCGGSDGLRHTFAGNGAPAFTSCTSAQIVDWHDVLREIYFGRDAASPTTQNCQSACRLELANSYPKLFENSCTVGPSQKACTQLQHAFRRNDESGTTDVFQKALLPSAAQLSQGNNFSPFCNNATQGPGINAPAMPTCATNTDCGSAGTCNTTTGQCSKVSCDATGGCPGGLACPSPGTATTQCTLVQQTSAQHNIASHQLCGCLVNADCPSGQTCDLATSQCTCGTNTDCSGTGTLCIGGECAVPPLPITCATNADCPQGVNSTCNTTTHRCTAFQACTPEPVHIIEGPGATYGLPGTGSSWVDVQDGDSIRRSCAFSAGSALEDVCNRDGNLGLVLPIWDATTTEAPSSVQGAVSSADAFPALTCTQNKFDCYSAQAFTVVNGASVYDLCPDGTNPNAPGGTNLCPQKQCAVPINTDNASIPKERRCINARGSLPVPVKAPVDGRVYNLTVWQRLNSGAFSMGRYPRSTGQLGSAAIGTTQFIAMQGAFFRLHMSSPTIASNLGIPNATASCQQPSATDQIGCLVRASPCSIGYAGNSAVNGDTVAINVNGYAPANQCIQPLVNNSPNVYPLSRRLFLNSVAGFEGIDPRVAANSGESNDKKNEFKLAGCYGLDDDGTGPHGEAAKIATAQPPAGFGFIPLGRDPFCDDVATNVCGSTAGGACGDNVAPIPSATIPF